MGKNTILARYWVKTSQIFEKKLYKNVRKYIRINVTASWMMWTEKEIGNNKGSFTKHEFYMNQFIFSEKSKETWIFSPFQRAMRLNVWMERKKNTRIRWEWVNKKTFHEFQPLSRIILELSHFIGPVWTQIFCSKGVYRKFFYRISIL